MATLNPIRMACCLPTSGPIKSVFGADIWPDTYYSRHKRSAGAMEKSYQIKLFRDALPTWNQRDDKYHTRYLKLKLLGKIEEKLKVTGKY
jgi:hypothetical protein